VRISNYLYIVYNNLRLLTNEGQSKRAGIMPCKSNSNSTHIERSHMHSSSCTVLLPTGHSSHYPQLGLPYYLYSLEERSRSCKISSFLCPVSMLSLVPVVHVMRSCCNHNVASIITTNFRHNRNYGQRFRAVRQNPTWVSSLALFTVWLSLNFHNWSNTNVHQLLASVSS
jgi:hypothetical protein